MECQQWVLAKRVKKFADEETFVQKKVKIPSELKEDECVMGMTAYGGVTRVLKLKKGDVVLVSAAAGAVGSAVGQICKLLGAKKVIGICGGPEKCELIQKDHGFDAAIDYKKQDSIQKMRAEIYRLTKEEGGIDCYFDNVGGYITASVWPLVREFGRVAICGQISMYNSGADVPLMPQFLQYTIYRKINIRGFVQNEWSGDAEFVKEFQDSMSAWIEHEDENKRLKWKETVVKGFDNLPTALNLLFVNTQKKKGKVVVEL